MDLSNASTSGELTSYDVLVIGAGQAAEPLTFALAKAGRRVALAERKYLGGSCVNFGCTPTKAVIASARVAHLVRRASEFGLKASSVEVDFPAVLAAAKAIVLESRDGLNDEFKDSENPVLLRGHARFVGRDAERFHVRIGDDHLVSAKQVVIDTGTRCKRPDIPGLDAVSYLTSDNWLDHTVLPEHLIFLGGGYIGLEMAQFYRRMGSRVTVVDRGKRLMGREEPEVSDELRKILEGEGIIFQSDSQATHVNATNNGVRVELMQNETATVVEGSHLFLAVGRTPNTDNLGLENIGLTLKDDGIVPVDERLATPVEGVWAVGDIRGGPMFTHTSWDDFRILLSQMTGDGARTTKRNVPYTVFTDPQLGRVGVTEAEARKQGKRVKVGHFDVRHNGHMREFRERHGFIKVVVDAETERLLGATLLCDEAGELLHIYEMLMNGNLPYTVLRDAVITHPTRAEAAQSATENVK